MKVYVLGYKGKGIISRLIRWQTRSEFSHVSVEVEGTNYEAWADGVVARKWNEGHRKGTEVVVFEPQGGVVDGLLWKALKAQVGKKYDYKSVCRFLTRRDTQMDEKWFCAELVAWAFAYAGLILQKMKPSYLSPRDICMSPNLQVVGKRRV